MPGFPIRTSPDQRLVGSSPRLIAASYVLRRLLAPRHPPCALCNLATFKDARARYVVLKVPGPVSWSPTSPDQPGGLGPAEPSVRRPRSWTRAAGEVRPTVRRTLPQNSTVCATGRFRGPPFRTHGRDRERYWAGAEQPDRVASDRPWSTRPVSAAWLPGSPRDEDCACSLERR